MMRSLIKEQCKVHSDVGDICYCMQSSTLIEEIISSLRLLSENWSPVVRLPKPRAIHLSFLLKSHTRVTGRFL
jgi:hypothetical protein